jgi:hypothetical protein
MSELLAVLGARHEQLTEVERDGWIFRALRSRRAPAIESGWIGRFELAVTRAGLNLRAVTPRTMSRTSSKLIHSDFDLAIVQRISGHAQPRQGGAVLR